jgi:hypothetical protein
VELDFPIASKMHVKEVVKSRKMRRQVGVVTHTCNPSTLEAEA